MAMLKVVLYPHPALRKAAPPVTVFDAALKKQAEDMLETMYAFRGAGLAANQVDYPGRIFVMDISRDANHPYVLVNPEIIERDGETLDQNGCLSAPGIYPDKIMRSQRIKVRYQDIHGAAHEMDAEDLLSICIQHENDHLDGIMFFDHLSRLKRERLLDKYRKTKDKFSM